MNFTKKLFASSLPFLAAVSFLVGGCASPGKRTAIGAGAGGATGAAIGAAAGGWKGAAIGAAVGAGAGGLIGNRLDKQAQELSQVAETRRTADGILVKLQNDLLFDTDNATLRPQANQQLLQLASVLAKYPQDRINIVGHTDSVGSENHNLELSRRRAESVRRILTDNRVRPEQIIVQGAGEARPIANNNSAEGRAQNRRVELHIDMPDSDQPS